MDNVELKGTLETTNDIELTGNIEAKPILAEVAWGKITGTLADQEDLQNELDLLHSQDVSLSELIDTEQQRAVARENAIELEASDTYATKENLVAETTRATARENEIEAKIPSHDNFATKTELNSEIDRAKGVEESIKEDVIKRSLITETGNKVDLELDTKTYELTAKLYDKNNNLISTSTTIDLPLETLVLNVEYDKDKKAIIITLKDGTTKEVPVGDLISGLVDEETFKKQVYALLLNDEEFRTNISHIETYKQDKITDLDTIRSGASKGATAVQDSNYVHTDNNFTDTYKSNVEANNKKVSNVQADWNATEGEAVILNKPTDLGKVDDVKVNGTSVVTDKVANIDLSSYATSKALNAEVERAEGVESDLQTQVDEIKTIVSGKRYGYKREKSNSSPSGRITYLYDAVGMTPAYMDYTNSAFNYGSWKGFVDSICRPVMLNYDGTVAYELGHDDQNYKLDGTASDITNSSFGGNAMVEFSKFKWVKRWEDDTYEYVVFSDIQYDEGYNCYAFINRNGVVQDKFYWGMFEGTNISSVMRSLGIQSNPSGNTTAVQEMTYAKANGNGWNIIYWSGWNHIFDLLTLITKSDDCQTAVGRGRGGQSSLIANGKLVSKGAFYGSNNDTDSVKAFYIENLWGNQWQRMNGCVLDGTNGIKVKMYGEYPTPTATSSTYSDYIATGVTPSGTSGNQISAEVVNEYGLLPKTASGSTTTYLPDSYYFNTSQVDFALVGAGCLTALGRAGRALALNALFSISDDCNGSRPSYLPE